MKRRMLTLIAGLVVVAGAVVTRQPDPRLEVLRRDYMASWSPALAQGEMKFERTSDGKRSAPAATLIRSISLLSSGGALAAQTQGVAAAEAHGWIANPFDRRPGAPRTRAFDSAQTATLTLSISEWDPHQLQIQLEIVG